MLALTILTGQITLAFSMFAVAVALPNIMSALSADASGIHWVMTGFQITRTVPMPARGWCSSLLGHHTLYIAGLVTTVAATICCGLAWNLESLLVFRVLQGLSAAPTVVDGLGDRVADVLWLGACAPDHNGPQHCPPQRLSMGSGLDGIHQGFASAFGIALGSTLLERRLTAHQIGLGNSMRR